MFSVLLEAALVSPQSSRKPLCFSQLGDQVAHEPLEVPGPALGGLQHLLVVGPLVAVVVHHDLVGDEGQAQDAQAAVTSRHHLRNRAHTCGDARRRNKEELFLLFYLIGSNRVYAQVG